MKPYRTFSSFEVAEAYFKEIGRLKFFGHVEEYIVYNFYHNDGRMFHLNIYKDGRVTYDQMSQVVKQYWKSQENQY